jgi:hypothetical protein
VINPYKPIYGHIRPSTLLLNKKGKQYLGYERGAITIAYYPLPDAIDKPAVIGLAFCTPEDQWSRSRGRSIASSRLGTSPLRLSFEGLERPLTYGDILAGLRTLAIDSLRGWEYIDENVLKPRSNERWGVALIGPGGSLLTAYVDVKAKAPKGSLFRKLTAPRGAVDYGSSVPGEGEHPWPDSNGHWAMRIPSFGECLLGAP